ncbi:YHR122W [Zygosaccharomyces parabailii]|nr:YHR122W [Zygosaccharomyces parabailii]
MSEFINENPNVLEDNLLPTRPEDTEGKLLLGPDVTKDSLNRTKLLLRIDSSLQSRALQNVELLTKLLQLEETPDLVTDESEEDSDDTVDELGEPADSIDAQEIYDLISHISDPEHPLTLGQLAVVNLQDIEVHDSGIKDQMAEVVVKITPTITHCSLATLIGLGIRVRLDRALPARFRITILLKEGSHQSENQVNKQLNDKERVSAACENEQLLGVISKMLTTVAS